MNTNHHESPQELNVPELDEDFVRAKLEAGFAAIERGEVEDWDSALIKADSRALLNRKHDGFAG